MNACLPAPIRRILAGLACLLSALGSGEAEAQTAATQQADGEAPVRCAINETRTGGGLMLHGAVSGTAPAQGQYKFVVSKAGQAGTSNISQGGAFTLVPGADVGVAALSLSLERGASYTAILTVTVADRTVICRASGAAATDL